jgi:hypothetical protein
MKACCVLILAAFLVLFILPPPATTQEKPAAAAETVGRVPELEDFHAVIYKLWHTAWPNKDIGMLVSLQPEIAAGAASVAGASLPGILRDKKEAWQKSVGDLQQCVGRYGAAASARDSARLLDEAEKLHMQYEKMVRLIRPPMKELEAFHTELYMLYHHYGPNFELAKIRTSAGAMKEKMTILNGAALPDRYKAKADIYRAARAKLSMSVDALQGVVTSGDRQEISRAIDGVHTNYLTLEKVFE